MRFNVESFFPDKDLPEKKARERAFEQSLDLFVRAVEKGEISQITDIKKVFSSDFNGGKTYHKFYHVVIDGKIKDLSMITKEIGSKDVYPYIVQDAHSINLPDELDDCFKAYMKDLTGWEVLELSPID